MKFTTLVAGWEIPENIKKCLEEQPARSGMYNWLFLHGGEINAFQNIKDDLEKFDQVQINMSPADMVIIPEVRRILENSSTMLVLNNDYVSEYWGKWNIDPFKYDNIQRMGDMVFGTEPYQVSNMIDGTFCIPHPTNTELLKHLGTDNAQNNCISTIFHWWAGESYIPFRTVNKMRQIYKIPKLKIYGYEQEKDSMSKYHGFMWSEKVPIINFREFAQMIQKDRIIYDPNPCHTYGRNGVELACLKKPVIGSNRVFSYNKLFPELTCDPYDFNATAKLFKMYIEQPDKIKEIADRAYDEVEYFNYKNSEARWNEAIDICKDRGGVEYYRKQL
jgi:hypothetical protein